LSCSPPATKQLRTVSLLVSTPRRGRRGRRGRGRRRQYEKLSQAATTPWFFGAEVRASHSPAIGIGFCEFLFELSQPVPKERGLCEVETAGVHSRNETRPHEGNVSNATTIVEPLSNSKNKTRSWDNSQAFKAASEQPVPTKNETRRHGNVYQSHANVSNATTSMEPLSFGACCDLEHRITRNLNTLVSAMRTKRHAYVCWKDIQWNVIFNDTAHITEGKE
jgi:hypothetical protein